MGVAPGAWIINILACCDGDIQDIIEGAEWAIENKEAKGIDILTSSLGEQQLEIHFDNDGSSAWSQQMDAVAASGIITFLSAGNEFGGATFAGCNTIDSPGRKPANHSCKPRQRSGPRYLLQQGLHLRWQGQARRLHYRIKHHGARCRHLRWIHQQIWDKHGTP